MNNCCSIVCVGGPVDFTLFTHYKKPGFVVKHFDGFTHEIFERDIRFILVDGITQGTGRFGNRPDRNNFSHFRGQVFESLSR